MRVEGDRHHREAALAAELRRTRDDALMTQVHAIELADRDDPFTPSCGDLIKALPAVHESPALLRSAPSLAMPHAAPGPMGHVVAAEARGIPTSRTSGHITYEASVPLKPTLNSIRVLPLKGQAGHGACDAGLTSQLMAPPFKVP